MHSCYDLFLHIRGRKGMAWSPCSPGFATAASAPCHLGHSNGASYIYQKNTLLIGGNRFWSYKITHPVLCRKKDTLLCWCQILKKMVSLGDTAVVSTHQSTTQSYIRSSNPGLIAPPPFWDFWHFSPNNCHPESVFASQIISRTSPTWWINQRFWVFCQLSCLLYPSILTLINLNNSEKFALYYFLWIKWHYSENIFSLRSYW